MSQHYEAIRRALATYFSTNWTACEIRWPNEADKKRDDEGNDPWCRFTILWAGAERECMTGNPDTGRLIYGSLVIQFFTPSGRGDAQATAMVDTSTDLLAEKVISAFNGKKVVTQVPFVQAIGNDSIMSDKRSQWFQVNLTTPFEYRT
jgi:hypothetical protein